jgi:hypothetical protein
MSNNEDLQKSLVDIIDEALEEIEALKKSKFAAAEIKIEGPGGEIHNAPTNGELDAKKGENCGKNSEVDESVSSKGGDASGKNADAGVKKAEDDDDDDEDDKKDKDKDKDKDIEKAEQKKKDKQDYLDIIKSEREQSLETLKKSEDLIKSYIDGKFSDLDKKIEAISQVVAKMADAPVQAKGVPSGIRPLAKSDEREVQPLAKSEVANKLLELKKSGKDIDSVDIITVETGSDLSVRHIMNKYGIN